MRSIDLSMVAKVAPKTPVKQTIRGPQEVSRFARFQLYLLDKQVNNLLLENKFDEARALIDKTQERLKSCGCSPEDQASLNGVRMVFLAEHEYFLFQQKVLQISEREREERAKYHGVGGFFKRMLDF